MLTGKGHRRGPAVLEFHDGVLPMILDGDEVLDGVQEITARSKAWSSISGASCNGVKPRLELGDLAAVFWARRRMASRREFGWRQSYPGVQDIEASLVGRYAESRCYGARGIGRRSSCRGQRDLDTDDLDVLVHKRGRKHVREVRVIMLRMCDAVKD
jgi:hypothetical protein